MKKNPNNPMEKKTQNIKPNKKEEPNKLNKYQHLSLNFTGILKPHISFWYTNAQHIWLWTKFPLLESDELSHVKKKPQNLKI